MLPSYYGVGLKFSVEAALPGMLQEKPPTEIQYSNLYPLTVHAIPIYYCDLPKSA